MATPGVDQYNAATFLPTKAIMCKLDIVSNGLVYIYMQTNIIRAGGSVIHHERL